MVVEFAKSNGELTTLEGIVKYAAGDALVTGVRNERWPIPRMQFDATYTACEGTLKGESGSYIKKPLIVTAYQCSVSSNVALPDGSGTLNAIQGDWIVSDNTNNRWVVADDIFRETYEKV